MSGTVTVRRVRDWLTPYRVEVAIDGRKPTEPVFQSAERAQVYALGIAEEHDLTLAYVMEDDSDRGPIKVTPDMFAQRVQKICSKCREGMPLARFRSLYRHNATDGQRVHNGWAERCVGCEEVHGE